MVTRDLVYVISQGAGVYAIYTPRAKGPRLCTDFYHGARVAIDTRLYYSNATENKAPPHHLIVSHHPLISACMHFLS